MTRDEKKAYAEAMTIEDKAARNNAVRKITLCDATVEKHDNGLVQRWNQRVKPGDTVIHNGDFIWADGSGKDVEQAVGRGI